MNKYKSEFAAEYGEKYFWKVYRMIEKFNPAIKELENAGYEIDSKKITPAQQEVFYKYLGNPNRKPR